MKMYLVMGRDDTAKRSALKIREEYDPLLFSHQDDDYLEPAPAD
jgi:hypothetical protein